jgi:hypothetical protein
MARTMIAAIALMLPLLAGCKGFYVAGDGGAHGAQFSAPPPTPPRVPGPPPR